jgi:hypothetical protein
MLVFGGCGHVDLDVMKGHVGIDVTLGTTGIE